MAVEPAVKRAIVFVDGQNLFHAVKEAFGYTFPNYDCRRLAAAVCSARDWNLKQVRFYTGVPAGQDDPFWNHSWNAKLAQLGRQGVWVRLIGRRDSRWIKLASAFLTSPRYRNRRGIAGMDWIPIDREAYDACIDLRDYRPK